MVDLAVVVFIVSLVLILVFLGIFGGIFINETNIKNATSGRDDQGNIIQGTLVCDENFLQQGETSEGNPFCAVNNITGVKRCPENGGTTLNFNPNTEFCSRQNFCDAPDFFAVAPDDRTLDKICQSGDTGCRCSKQIQCPKFVKSYFTAELGNAFLPNKSQILTFSQNNSFKNIQGKDVFDPPLVIPDNTENFCFLNSSELPFVSPGLCTDKNLPDCLKSNSGLCISGTLAVIGNAANKGIDNLVVGCIGIKNPNFCSGNDRFIVFNPDGTGSGSQQCCPFDTNEGKLGCYIFDTITPPGVFPPASNTL